MADFKIDGRMKVKKLKELFKEEFGGTLRVYNGRSLADDDATLASIRCNDDAKGGEFTCRASRTVGKFCQEILNTFGIKVKVATPDDWVIVPDGITLATLKDLPKQAVNEDLLKFVAYKKDVDTSTKKKKYKLEICVRPIEFQLYVGEGEEDLTEDNVNNFENIEWRHLVEVADCSNVDGMENPEDLDWEKVLEVTVTDEDGNISKLDRKKFKIGEFLNDHYDEKKVVTPSTLAWRAYCVKKIYYDVELELDEKFDENKFSFVQMNYFSDNTSCPFDSSYITTEKILYDGEEYETFEDPECDYDIYETIFRVAKSDEELGIFSTIIDSYDEDEDLVDEYYWIIEDLAL